MDAIRLWINADEISSEDRDITIRQIYCWIKLADEKIIIVSKDGTNWQFPGGKPDAGESLHETLIREVYEETGLNISDEVHSARLFGYYKITEGEQKYLQLRFALHHPKKSDQIVFAPHERETDTDKIEYVDIIRPKELVSRIPWLKERDELRSFLSI